MKDVICLAGPSGVGKSFYARLLVKELNFARPKTVTTRKARRDDDNHIYLSIEEFRDLIKNNQLLEWDKYSENYYGIMLNEFQSLLLDEKSKEIVMDLTLEGCLQVKNFCKKAIIIAFVPDDVLWLRNRLVERGMNDPQEIEKRMKISEKDLKKIRRVADYVICCKYDSESTDEILKEISGILEKNLKRK